MNEALQNLEIKVENEGTTPQGRLTATEWNILVAAVKAIDADDTKIDSAEIIRIVKEAGYVTSSDLARAYVTIYAPQTISARHDFTDGLKVGGLPIYKSQDDTLYLDCNLVVRGGITARGTNETVTASIFEALPIDGSTIKRTANGELYVDAEALNIGGGGGVADSVSWENITGKPSWIGATKPTYTASEVGALPLTGGTVNGILSLGKTLNVAGDFYIYHDAIGRQLSLHPSFTILGAGNLTNGNPTYVDGHNVYIRYANDTAISSFLSNGNAAIGGTTANEKLHVHGQIIAQNTFGGMIFLFDNAVGQNRAVLVLDPDPNSGVGVGGDYLTLEQRMDGSAILATPFLTLGLGLDKTLSVSGNILATGGITARYTSDMRLKQNRRGFKASEVLMSLGAVQQFEYIPSEVAKNKIYEGTHIGLIYQNVVGTALNRMCYEREDGYGSLNYYEPSFISLLAGVGQEHEVRLTEYEREIQALKKKVEQLEKRVA